MLSCLNGRLCTYQKGEYVFRQGEYIEDITVLVEGQLHIQRYDYWGNSNIISVVEVGEMSSRSTRQKLISYLSEESAKQKSSTFEIPFNRQQLADFLSVDRSAMSNELCKMRDDGLIRFERNRFTLI